MMRGPAPDTKLLATLPFPTKQVQSWSAIVLEILIRHCKHILVPNTQVINGTFSEQSATVQCMHRQVSLCRLPTKVEQTMSPGVPLLRPAHPRPAPPHTGAHVGCSPPGRSVPFLWDVHSLFREGGQAPVPTGHGPAGPRWALSSVLCCTHLTHGLGDSQGTSCSYSETRSVNWSRSFENFFDENIHWILDPIVWAKI